MTPGDLVSIVPSTSREHTATKRLGAEGWKLREIRTVPCITGGPAALVSKDGHQRWVRTSQVRSSTAS